ncbi:hypothetical protein [Stieleria mannarensis]|uniref:hypothetical protein n=1 Tax=Stieleria mannarensis TaxID=2755585 RepID=UPI0016013229|nr:hypothetical protein [Rhodopirellula sp. JC639]
MDLREIEIPVCWDAPPPKILRTIGIADRLREALTSDACESDIPALVNSNFYIAYHALRHVREAGMGGDLSFCEWGSGLGVVTCIASQLGFNATGIEIEGSLCRFATTLSNESNARATFIRSSYRDGPESCQGPPSQQPFPIGQRMSDVIYAYPWPAEERYIESLFRRMARRSSVLITYHGGTKLRARKLKS